MGIETENGMKSRRKIIQIDEEKCTGCGLCVTSCAEGALQLIDGKAHLLSEVFCDGLGACIGECPEGALKIIERESQPFDEQEVEKHLKKNKMQSSNKSHRASQSQSSHTPPRIDAMPCGCPGSAMQSFGAHGENEENENYSVESAKSRLTQWPVQLTLVPPEAPFLKNADLLIAADCVPFASPDFHESYLKGHALLVGCPKLDDIAFYREKIEEIFRVARPKSVTVVRMEVPCCGGLAHIVTEAQDAAGIAVPVEIKVIGIRDGKVLKSEVSQPKIGSKSVKSDENS